MSLKRGRGFPRSFFYTFFYTYICKYPKKGYIYNKQTPRKMNIQAKFSKEARRHHDGAARFVSSCPFHGRPRITTPVAPFLASFTKACHDKTFGK